MTIGTKSVLFGAHQCLIHPWFVAWAWWTLYGFPFDPRLWVAFFVHDFGYVGKPNMDGSEGETHPELGARIMSVFGSQWSEFSLLHSRYYAKTLGKQPSRLCVADKLAIALTPAWLYLPMVRATGEIYEYMAHAKHRLVGNHQISADERARLLSASQAEWYAGVQSYCRRWAYAHVDGAVDTWTSDARQRATINEAGVWKQIACEQQDQPEARFTSSRQAKDDEPPEEPTRGLGLDLRAVSCLHATRLHRERGARPSASLLHVVREYLDARGGP